MSYKLEYGSYGPVMTNCYTLINEDTKEAILVDASGRGEQVLRFVKASGAKPVALLLTHGHFDHIDAVEQVRSEYPDIEVIIGKNEEIIMSNPDLNLSYGFTGSPLSIKADRTVGDNEDIELIGLKIHCIEVPGHTIGGMCYYIQELKMLFDGDTLFCGSIGRSDFPTGDGEALIKNISEKLLTLPEDTKVYPGHDMETNIGREKVSNMYF